MTDEPLYSAEDFGHIPGDPPSFFFSKASEIANALHQERCPYKARGIEDENGNEYSQVMAMKYEVAKLQSELLFQMQEAAKDLVRQADQLKKENERFRRALESISTTCPHWDCCAGMNSGTTSKTDFSKCDCHVAEARAALEGK